MTLRRKMTLQIGAMIAGVLAVCLAAVWGVRGLRGEYGAASAGYRELREVYEVAAHVDKARALLAVGQRALASAEIDRATAKLDVVMAHGGGGGESILRGSPDGPRLAGAFRDAIRHAAAELRLPPDEAFHGEPEAANEALGRATGGAAAIAMTI